MLIARSVGDALQVVSSRGRELTFAILDFNDGCRGVTLLSAINTCYQQLPTLVVTAKESKDANVVAYANGARVCLNKPLPSARLADAKFFCDCSSSQLVDPGESGCNRNPVPVEWHT